MVEVIYHLADIHITANLERQEEYKDVLKKAINKIKGDKRDKLVVIVGDLFHEKTKVYQEANVMARNFLKELGDVCETIITPGNHDVAIDNEHRTDSIEATLCNLIKKNKINYLTENKIYKIRGINFGVTKMTNNLVTKIENKKKGEIYVGLYHGTLYKSQTNDGYKFEDKNKIKASNFKDYDYTMLGDIHLYQYMNKKKTIAYCGSLIQQNFGESINNHGMLVWNLKNKTSELMEIENKYIYKTHIVRDIKNTKIENIEGKKCRLRLKYENINILKMYEYEEKIEEIYDIKSITRKEILNKENNKDDIKQISEENPSEVIKRYCEEKKIKLDDKGLEVLKKMIDEEYKKIEVVSRGIKLYELEFSGLLKYGNDNLIKFHELNGVNMLTGKNALGKSSIIDILLFTLYDKYSRGVGKEILNIRRENGYSILRLELNNKKYTIQRKIIKGRVDVHIFKGYLSKEEIISELKDEGNKNISEDGKKNIDKQIVNMFGNYNDMIMTSIILQVGQNFIDVEDKEKKRLLIEMLGLDVYERIRKRCGVEDRNLTLNIMSSIKKRMSEVNYENLIKTQNKEINIKQNKGEELKDIYKSVLVKKNVLESNIGKININIDESELKLNDNQTKIKIIKKEKNKLENNNEDENTITKENKNKEKKLNNLYEKKNETLEDKNKLENESKEIHTKIKKLKEEEKISQKNIKKIQNNIDKDENINEYEKNKEKITKKINKKKMLINNLEIIKETNKYLLEHKFEKKCKCCEKNKEIHKSIGYIEKIEKINEELKQYENIENELERIEKIIIKIKENEKNKNENEKELLKHEIIKNKIKLNNERLKKINEELIKIKENEIINKKIKKTEKEIKENNCKLENINKLKSLKEKEKEILEVISKTENDIEEYNKKKVDIEELKKINEEYEKIDEDIKKNNNETIILIEKKTLNKSLMDEQNKLYKESEDIQNKINTYKNILELYKNGLLEYIMNDKLKLLEKKVNNSIRSISDYEVKIKVEKDKVIFYKLEKMNRKSNIIKEVNARQLSGYERIAFNLSLRLGLNSMNIMTKNNFIIIDEGLSAADKVNVNKFTNLIEIIKKEYEICIIISHIDEIKNQKGRILEIEYDEETMESHIEIR